MRIVSLLLCMFLYTADIQAEVVKVANHQRDMLRDALHDYIVPSYSILQKATAELDQHTKLLCKQPNNTTLVATKEAFRNVVRAWSFVEPFRFGPVMDDDRVERFFFFPDRKGIGLRQVRKALVKEDKRVTNIKTLQQSSVALQGLGALDFLLFGKFSKTLAEGNEFRCQFAATVSENLHSMAELIQHAWLHDQMLRKNWQNPSNTNSFFRTEKEAMNQLIGLFIHSLEAIRDTRINVFFREAPKRDRPKSAAFWRSKSTMISITASLKGLESLYKESGFGKALPKESSHIDSNIKSEFRQSIAIAEELNGPVAALLKSPEQRQKLKHLNFAIYILISYFNDEFAPAAGLTSGFSFGDGD